MRLRIELLQLCSKDLLTLHARIAEERRQIFRALSASIAYPKIVRVAH